MAERENSRRIIYSIMVFVFIFHYDLQVCAAIISCEYRAQETVSIKIFKGSFPGYDKDLEGSRFKLTYVKLFLKARKTRDYILLLKYVLVNFNISTRISIFNTKMNTFVYTCDIDILFISFSNMTTY